ncbi:hypothetical protein M1116_00830 [Patescibacteria group bacterium]|nr:hypothetical protein [Patescibacteria group bacterium]
MSPKINRLLLIVLLLLGIFFQSIPVIRSGLLYPYGYGFWGPSGHDGIWHLTLINHIQNPLNIPQPAMSGEKLVNYHPLYDIIISLFGRITHLSNSFLNFQLAPIFLSSMLIILSFNLGKLLTKSTKGGVLLAFFNVAASSFGWIYTLITTHSLGGESLFWSMQAASTQLNPPFALSLVILLLFLYLLKLQKHLLILSFLAVISPITKSYAGLLIFFIFFLYSLNHRRFFKYFLISVLLSIPLFLIYNSASVHLFLVKPLWFVNSMLNSPDRFYLPKVASFIDTSLSSNHFDIRFIILEIIGIILFIVGNLGWRFLGLFFVPKKDQFLNILFFSLIIFSLIPLLFIQRGTPWNTIQFLYYSLFLANIFLSLFLTNNHHQSLLLLILITTVLANIPNISSALGNPSPSALPPAEIKALNFLRHQPGSNILSYPYDPYLRNKFSSTPLPLYAYETTAYVSAYSLKNSFLEDEMNLSISGYDYLSRRNAAFTFFKLQNPYQDRGFLVNNRIDYIYIANSQLQAFTPNLQELGLTSVYDEDHVLIFKVNR